MTLTMSPVATHEAALPLHHARSVIVVHDALRREFGVAGPLVRAVQVGEAARAGVVARHLELLLGMLQHHHELEDEVVWPLLLERTTGGSATGMVAGPTNLMVAQHREIDTLVRRISSLLGAWSTSASTDTRACLALLLDALVDLLEEHLHLEERLVLPMAERHLTAEDWQHIGAIAEERSQGPDRLVVFGMLQHEGDPEVIASMLAGAPLPVRMALPRLARRAYRRHSAELMFEVAR